MVALIPHQSDMLALAQVQRNILAALDAAAPSVFPCFPLWVTFPENSAADIQDIRKKTRTLVISAAEIKNGVLSFRADLQLADGTMMHGRIVFGKTNNAAASVSLSIPESSRSFFPHECRVFRAAEAQFSGCSWSVSESVWVKTGD